MAVQGRFHGSAEHMDKQTQHEKKLPFHHQPNDSRPSPSVPISSPSLSSPSSLPSSPLAAFTHNNHRLAGDFGVTWRGPQFAQRLAAACFRKNDANWKAPPKVRTVQGTQRGAMAFVGSRAKTTTTTTTTSTLRSRPKNDIRPARPSVARGNKTPRRRAMGDVHCFGRVDGWCDVGTRKTQVAGRAACVSSRAGRGKKASPSLDAS